MKKKQNLKSSRKLRLTEKLSTNTLIFYFLIGAASSLALSLVFYWSLSLNSNIERLIANTASTPLYFWPYVLLTLGTIVLFGISVPLLIHRWRKFGPPKIKGQAGAGFGAFVGVLASACPVCGSAILAALGIAGGLAIFPLQGLELKALSFGLMILPVWIITKELKSGKCDGKYCKISKNVSLKEKERPWLILAGISVVVLGFVAWSVIGSDPVFAKWNNQIINPGDNRLISANIAGTGDQIFDETVAKVLPEDGFQSKIALGDSIVKLVENGVIDKEKFGAIYRDGGGLPTELKDVLTRPSNKPILLTRENANYYVNLLWPLGLANYMKSNKESPVNGDSLFNFASTGGWNLGKEENGGAYFNKFEIVTLTPEQEALVTKVAQNTYRPCCNNPTFFQDCNHGSALLGLLQLGASQGLSEDELYREALAFNSFWFPHNYVQTALYFKAVKNVSWSDVDPKLVMGGDYSSISGWYENVNKKVTELGILKQTQGGGSCGV